MTDAGRATAELSATTDPTAQSIAEDDLPVARTEIELSAPPKKLVLAEPSTCTRKIPVFRCLQRRAAVLATPSHIRRRRCR
jgi:hypothetical protein